MCQLFWFEGAGENDEASHGYPGVILRPMDGRLEGGTRGAGYLGIGVLRHFGRSQANIQNPFPLSCSRMNLSTSLAG